MAQQPFSLRMKVRDYECDMQGIVNNTIYQHYLEHARHEFLQQHGISFGDLTRRGVIVVVIRAELDYLASLRGGDEFDVTVSVSRPSPLRLVFHQAIFRHPDAEPILRASIVTTAVNERQRPCFPEELAILLGD